MNRYKIIKALWFAACLAVLWFAYDAREISDVYGVFMYAMLALTFPIGIVAQGILFFIFNLFDSAYLGGFIGNLFFWVFSVGLGCWQWFVVLPWVIKRIKAANQKMKSDEI